MEQLDKVKTLSSEKNVIIFSWTDVKHESLSKKSTTISYFEYLGETPKNNVLL